MSDDQMSGDQIRRALAGALAGVARGLSASARMVEQVAWILRPREPAEGRVPPADAVDEPPGAESEEPVDAAEPVELEPEEPVEVDERFEGGTPEPAVTEVDPAPEPPPTVAAPEGPDRVKVAESHIAALAERPVTDVVAEIRGLSTDELEDLYAYEVTHKNRKTVLRAIERAVQPSSSNS